MHILRTNNCHDNDRLILFDNIVRRGLESILNVDLSTSQWIQACLPIRDGGLGVRTTVSLETSAFLASAMSTLALQELILPSVANTTDSAVVASQDRWTAITHEQPMSGVLARKQRSWDDAVVRTTKQDLSLTFTTDIQHARFKGAQSAHSGNWLKAIFQSSIVGCILMMKLCALRSEFVWAHKICHIHTCPCEALVDALGLHCFVCRRSTGKQTRHSLLNGVIWRSFSRAKIQSSKEPMGTFRDNKRPDGVTLIPCQNGKCIA